MTTMSHRCPGRDRAQAKTMPDAVGLQGLARLQILVALHCSRHHSPSFFRLSQAAAQLLRCRWFSKSRRKRFIHFVSAKVAAET
jgi:hypothetical protein